MFYLLLTLRTPTYTSTKYLEQTLNLNESKASYPFNDFRRLDLFWIQLMMTLQQVYPKEPLFVWCPYQWFYLLHGYAISQFYSASEITGAKRYHIIGNDSFLGRKAIETLPKNGKYSFSLSPFSEEIGTYYTLIANYIITVKLDLESTKRIANLFETVKSEKDLKNSNLNQVFGPRIKAKLVLEKNELKARKLKSKFEEFFGV